MKYKDVIKAVKKGKIVYWSNKNYKIIYDNYCDIYIIYSLCNNACIRLNDDNYYLKKCFID